MKVLILSTLLCAILVCLGCAHRVSQRGLASSSSPLEPWLYSTQRALQTIYELKESLGDPFYILKIKMIEDRMSATAEVLEFTTNQKDLKHLKEVYAFYSEKLKLAKEEGRLALLKMQEEARQNYQDKLLQLREHIIWDYQFDKVVDAIEAGETKLDKLYELATSQPASAHSDFILERFGVAFKASFSMTRVTEDGPVELPLVYRDVYLHPERGVASPLQIYKNYSRDFNRGILHHISDMLDELRAFAEDSNKFVNEVYSAEIAQGSREVFSEDFLNLIKIENDQLNPFRLSFFNYRDAYTGEMVATISLFDGSYKDSLYGQMELPIERGIKPDAISALRTRLDPNRRVLELRRLSKKKQIKNFNLKTILSNLADYLKDGTDLLETDLYLQTDRAGSILYKRFGFEVALRPEQIQKPDHYIMRIQASDFVKLHESGRAREAVYLPRVKLSALGGGSTNGNYKFMVEDYDLPRYLSSPLGSFDSCFKIFQTSL